MIHLPKRSPGSTVLRLVWFPLSAALVFGVAAGCTPKQPSVSRATTLSRPVPNRVMEMALRTTDGVESVEVETPPRTRYLFGGLTQDPDDFDFAGVELRGARGRMHQWKDMWGRTHLHVSASWERDAEPTRDDKAGAKRLLQRIMHNVLAALRAERAATSGEDHRSAASNAR